MVVESIMSTNDDPVGVTRSRNTFPIRHPLLALLVVFFSYGLPEALSQWEAADVLVIGILCFLVAAVVLIIEGIFLIIAISNLQIRKSFSHLTAIFLLVASVLFANRILFFMKYAQLYAFAGEYESCITSAVEYANEGRFKVCTFRSDGNSFTMVVYDSGGQMDIPQEQQSPEFRSLMGPIMRQCNTGAELMMDHFYFVQSAC